VHAPWDRRRPPSSGCARPDRLAGTARPAGPALPPPSYVAPPLPWQAATGRSCHTKPPLLPPDRSPLRFLSSRLHEASHLTAPRRTEARWPKSTPRYFHRHCRPSKLLELKKILAQTDLPAPIKGPARLPTSPRTAQPNFPAFQASKHHHHQPPEPAATRRHEAVSTCDFGPRWAWGRDPLGSPSVLPHLPAVAVARVTGGHPCQSVPARPAPPLYRSSGGVGVGRRWLFSQRPLAFFLFPHRAPPLYSLSPLLSKQTLSLKLYHKNNPAPYN
jgi:hypothetical protein